MAVKLCEFLDDGHDLGKVGQEGLHSQYLPTVIGIKTSAGGDIRQEGSRLTGVDYRG